MKATKIAVGLWIFLMDSALLQVSILVVSRVLAGRHKDLPEEMRLNPSPALQHRGTTAAALLTPDTQSLPVWSPNSNTDIKCCFLFTCLLAL